VEDLVLRSTPRQLRGLLKGCAITAAIAVPLIAVGAVFPAGRGAVIPSGVGIGVGSLIFLATYLFKRSDVTEATALGLRNRNFGRSRRLTWDEIADITVRTGSTALSTPTATVRVTPVRGRKFTLAAPVDGGAMVDPAFREKYKNIRAHWRAYAPGRYEASIDPDR
jgi:hypothetical protein